MILLILSGFVRVSPGQSVMVETYYFCYVFGGGGVMARLVMADVDERFFPATSMPDEDWWSELWPDPEGVLRDTGLRRGMRAVDLCCGYGWFTGAMARIAGAGNVFAVDLDAGMIEAARRRLAAEGAPECMWITGDARELNRLMDERADYVLIANTFHGVPDKRRLAACVADILKEGGRLVIINWHARAREETTVLGQPRGPATEMRMSPDDVREEVEPAGLRLVETRELPPWHYAAIFEK